ncbi:hypothetical protein H0H92_006278 [Tricholoma furcatifolium]|nr:hypothetical protein H0H92_006278 [Tricholoma furcatifolium]
MVPRRPRIWVNPDLESAAPPMSATFIGRPLFRWITWAIVVLLVFLLLGPLLIHPHYFDFSDYGTPDFPSHLRPPPPLPWMHPSEPDPKWAARAEKVKEAFVHAYEGYKAHAFPMDELVPVTGEGINNFNGWGVTLFDALDTMWIMGLNETFNDALDHVARSTFVSTDRLRFAPFFETIIRYLGGMLSAYALSGQTILLTRADDLATKLLPAFNTTSGIPVFAVDTGTGQLRLGWNGDQALWAEALSNQLEFKYLAHLTGREEYFEKTERVMRLMYNPPPKDIFPTIWDIKTGRPANDHFSVGAYADSAHEYLLKQWLLTDRSEPKTLDLYLRSMNAVINNLMYLTPKRKLLYVTDTRNSIPTHTLEHLSCFLPGLLALGVHTLELSEEVRELHMWAAEGLARTCWATYADTNTGLGADEMAMLPGEWLKGDKGLWITHLKKWDQNGRRGPPPGLGELKVTVHATPEEREYQLKKSMYLLRPETLESFYILWRTTGNQIWRERGWTIFQSIEKYARTDYGYTSISKVDNIIPDYLNQMPSYFLAETLKYLYLLFTEDDLVPLDEWVFNTEAHPLPIFKWKQWEKEKYGIPL